MKTKFLSLLLATTMCATLLAGCGSTEKTAEETEQTVEVEVEEEEEEPIYPTEEDIETFTTGIEDYHVLQGSTGFKTRSIDTDQNIIDGVYIDISNVDFDTVGEYEVSYTVFFNEENFTAYTKDTESYEEDFIDAVMLDENGNVIKEETTEDTDDVESTEDEESEEVEDDESTDETTENAESETTDDEVNPYAVTVTKLYIIVEDNGDVVQELIDSGVNVYTNIEEDTEEDAEESISESSTETTSDTTTSSRDTSSSSSTNSTSSSSSASNSSSATTTTCNHNWVAQTTTVHHDATGHYESVCVQEAYDSEEVTGTEEHAFCRGCGIDMTAAGLYGESITAHIKQEMLNGTAAGYYTKGVNVTSTVHHDAVYQDQWVQDTAAYDETVTTGYVCSICGATK